MAELGDVAGAVGAGVDVLRGMPVGLINTITARQVKTHLSTLRSELVERCSLIEAAHSLGAMLGTVAVSSHAVEKNGSEALRLFAHAAQGTRNHNLGLIVSSTQQMLVENSKLTPVSAMQEKAYALADLLSKASALTREMSELYQPIADAGIAIVETRNAADAAGQQYLTEIGMPWTGNNSST
jgi:hypothetical protein